jgi:hypothetical protein
VSNVGQAVYLYCLGGAIAWAAVLFLWRRFGDFEAAAGLVCRGVAGLGWWLGYFIAGFWLASFAFACVLFVLAAAFIGLSSLIDRRRARKRDA